MRQRVAIARTLIEDSPLVLLDEPFASIDSLNRHKLQTLIAKVLSKKTVLLVTHDPLEALRLGHRIFIMEGIPAKIRELKITLGDNIPRNTSRADVLLAQANLLKSLAPANAANKTSSTACTSAAASASLLVPAYPLPADIKGLIYVEKDHSPGARESLNARRPLLLTPC